MLSKTQCRPSSRRDKNKRKQLFTEKKNEKSPLVMNAEHQTKNRFI